MSDPNCQRGIALLATPSVVGVPCQTKGSGGDHQSTAGLVRSRFPPKKVAYANKT